MAPRTVLPFALVAAYGAVLALLVGGTLLLERNRSRRLARRVRLPLEELIDGLGPEARCRPELAGRVLDCLARHLDVEAGVLRPEDRFDRELGLGWRWIGLCDVALELFFEELATLLHAAGVSGWRGFSAHGRSLRDLVDAVLASAKQGAMPERGTPDGRAL